MDEERIIKEAARLEPLPTTVTRLSNLLAADEWEFKDILECVSLDQALTGRLLRIANSAYANRGVTIQTAQDAITRLGANTVLSFAMGEAVKRQIDGALPEYGFQEGELWRHSVAAMLTAEVIITLSRKPLPKGATTVALLHDVGKLVLGRLMTEEDRNEIGKVRATKRVSVFEAESEVLHTNHAEVGTLVARYWGLPESFLDGIGHHHVPRPDSSPVADVVFVANIVSKRIRGAPVTSGRFPKTPLPSWGDLQVPEDVRLRLGLEPEALETLKDTVDSRFEAVLARFS